MTADATRLVRAVVGRTLLAVVLGARAVGVRRRTPHRRPGGAVAGSLALAAAVPVAAARRGEVSLPASGAGRLLLIGYVLPGAVVEELLWRGPLTRAPSARGTATSVAGFVALHVLRDGVRSAPAHLTLACTWTASALLGRTVVWSALSHGAYNLIALSVRPR